jgi:general secretion pathway protein L
LADYRLALPACEFIYLLAAGDVALCTAPVTQAERKLYRQMLPYAMEEGLIEATDELHFAFRSIASDIMGVVLVRRTTFQAILDDLRGAGIRVDVIVPETLLLPWNERQQTWVLQGDQIIARTGPCGGFQASIDNVEQVVGLPDGGNPPCDDVLLVVERGGDADRAATAVRSAGRNIELQPVENLLAWQASQLTESSFNMLQGDFQPPLRWRKYWNDWKLVAAIGLAAVLLNYAVLLYQYANVKATARDLQAEKHTLARKAIPSGKITSPERQLRAALSQLSTSGPTRFGPLLAAVGPALGGESGYTVRTINFDGNAGILRLEVRSRDFQQIEKFRTQMQQRGLQAQLLNSSAQGEGILARLELKEGGR